MKKIKPVAYNFDTSKLDGHEVVRVTLYVDNENDTKEMTAEAVLENGQTVRLKGKKLLNPPITRKQ